MNVEDLSQWQHGAPLPRVGDPTADFSKWQGGRPVIRPHALFPVSGIRRKIGVLYSAVSKVNSVTTPAIAHINTQ